MEEIVLFGETSFRGKDIKFGIKPDDRRRHMYVIGKTGMGKTEFLKNMAIQDIKSGRGVAYIDPHGDAADELLRHIPKDRIKDVVYFNPADIEHPIAFNIMEKVGESQRHLIADGIMGVFKKIWPDVWSARMEYILNNTVLSLLESEGSTLLGINRMLSDKGYREKIIDNITDPIIKAFWLQEFAKYTDRLAVEATAAVQNKIGQFTSSLLIRNTVGQEKSSINIREIMDNGKILIINLSKGRIGEDSSRLLGALLITKIQLAAMSRVDIPKESDRKDFYLYVDEFQNFATESFASILAEARKYRLNLILAHQYISQMDEKVRDAVFGNVGTLVTFRVGAEDAEFLEKEFSPEFTANDIVNLAKYSVYLKLMIDGIATRPFWSKTLPPFPILEDSDPAAVIGLSRSTYGVSRKEVEDSIAKWANEVHEVKEKPKPKKQFDKQRSYDRPRSSNDQRPFDRQKSSNEQRSYDRPKSSDEQKPKSIGLQEALKKGPIDFKGRPAQTKRPEVDKQDLKKLLDNIQK